MQIRTLITAKPTLLNLSEENLASKVAVLQPALAARELTLDDWTPATLGAALSASLKVMVRLEYAAFAGNDRGLSPLKILQMPQAKFIDLWPTFPRWLRRKYPDEYVKL